MKRLYLAVIFVLAIALAGFGLAWLKETRSISTEKTTKCLSNLRVISGAKAYYAREHGLSQGAQIPEEVLLKMGVWPKTCPAGGTYRINPVGVDPECTVLGHKLNTEIGKIPKIAK